MKTIKVLLKISFYTISIFSIFIVAMLLIPNACFYAFHGYQHNAPLQAHEAPRYFEITSRDGLFFEQGMLIHIGVDYVAFGKYQMADSFDEQAFIKKHHLVQPWTG